MIDFKNKFKLNIIINASNYLEVENNQLQIKVKDNYFIKDNLQLDVYIEDGQIFKADKIISWIDFIKISKPTSFYIDERNRIFSDNKCNESDFLKLFEK